MHYYAAIVMLICLCCLSASFPTPAPRETPRSLDPKLEVVLFAQEPQIVHPVAVAFDKKGRLLVVESHTHFRPPGYQGPTHDRIRMLEDTDGDGRADRITTFFEGTKATMDIALAPDGSIYIATRNEILRLRDTKGTNQADERTRIVFLDTKGDYPHNGLSGLAFDQNGNLIFGMGENLGAGYTLIGSDGTRHKGGGEGGNIFRCTADGKNLKRVATGFWNPFGIHVDRFGRMIAVDNDPDASPPCRLLHIVEGGDYGYQFRYGRSGRHPFQSWNGQLAGTLPMICGVGEAPCEVLRYETNGFPEEYFGKYFVTSWADHRVEMYDLRTHGASYKANQKILVQGGKDFRPCGMTVAPDGSLFVSDWVLPDYNLHGKGTIWQVRPKQPFVKPELKQLEDLDVKAHQDEFEARQVRIKPPILKISHLSSNSSSHVRYTAGEGITRIDQLPILLEFLTSSDQFLQQAARRQLTAYPHLMEAAMKEIAWKTPAIRRTLLLAQQACISPAHEELLPNYLQDTDEELRFLAAKWIADKAIISCRPHLEAALRSSQLSVRLTIAFATALARLDGKEVNEASLADRFLAQLLAPETSDEQKMSLLRLIPVSHPKLTVGLLGQLASSPLPLLQQEVALALVLHPQAKKHEVIRALLQQANLASEVKELLTISLATESIEKPSIVALKERPLIENTAEWLNKYGSGGRASAGLRVFYHPKGPGCFRCHAINGRGNDIGPDLSTIGRSEPRRLMESLLQPSATVAPHYQAHTLVMHDGRTLNGILVKTYYDVYTYLSPEGKLFEVKSTEVAETANSVKSLMPEGLLNQLNDQEVKDLLAFLMSCK